GYAGIFPIHIHSIKLELSNKFFRALNKFLTAFGGKGHIRESVGAPSTAGYHHLKIRIALFLLYKCYQLRTCLFRMPKFHVAVNYMGKRKNNVAELLHRNGTWVVISFGHIVGHDYRF